MIREFGGKRPQIGTGVFVAEGAQVMGDVILADGVSVWFNAVLRGDLSPIIVGKGSNVQDGVVIHTDLGDPAEIADEVTVGHGAIVHGAKVGTRALIGMGAIVLSGSKVGAGAVVAAGALVPEGREIPPGWLAVGVPAKPVREVTDAERERILKGVVSYQKHRDQFLAEGWGRIANA